MSGPLAKARRHQAILELLRAEPVDSQEGLGRRLARRGIRVTQATLSRDLKELGVHHVPTGGGYRYLPADAAAEHGGAPAEPAPARMRGVAALEVTGIEANETVVVVRTLTGRAQGVAVVVDGLGLADVLATVAGDDTILVLPRSVRRTARLRGELERVFGIG